MAKNKPKIEEEECELCNGSEEMVIGIHEDAEGIWDEQIVPCLCQKQRRFEKEGDID